MFAKHLKSYNTAIAICCLILLAINIGFSNNSNVFFIFFNNYIENTLRIVLFGILSINLIIFLKYYFSNTFNGFSDIRRNRILLTLMFLSVITKLVVLMMFLLNHATNDEETIAYNINSIPYFYFLHLFAFSAFVFYFVKWSFVEFKEKHTCNHWIINYLTVEQSKKLKVYKTDNKIVSLSSSFLHIDEVRGVVEINKKKLNLKIFKQYLETKNCKLVDLIQEDILIIEMLSI